MPSEQELMKELNVGRGTIREAIKSLVSRNIVEIRRGVGTFVAKKNRSCRRSIRLFFY